MSGKERLGRGLGALLGEYAAPEGEEPRPSAGGISNLSITSIQPNPLQPRREFAEAELEELAQSIEENGLLQPLLVRSRPGGRYELVAGERRFRAISRLGWTDVPAVVRDLDDRTVLVFALVENLQREALSPLEEAEGYKVLAEEHGLTQVQIARAVGKDRSTVANALRLLGLPPSIRRLVESGDLSAGHARALLTVKDPVRAADLARRAVAEAWSVREIERQAGKEPKTKPSAAKRAARRDPRLAALERSLEEALSTRVRILHQRNGKGQIQIPFHDDQEFERLFELIAGQSLSDTLG